MQGVILAGGMGTRLQPLTLRTPKPMLSFFDRPMIGWLIEPLLEVAREVVVSTGHAGEAFEALRILYPHLKLVREAEPLGTGGALGYLREQGVLGSEPVWVQNGDTLLSLDSGAMLEQHRRSGAAGTVAVYRHPQPDRFGNLALDSDGRLLAFEEKSGASGWINAGVYILEPELLQQIDSRPSSLERHWFPGWIEAGVELRSFEARGYFADLGTVESYRQAHFDVLLGETGLSLGRTVWDGGAVSTGAVWCGQGVEVAPDCVLEGPLVVGAGSRLAKGAHLTRSVLGPNCRIGAGARISDCVVAAGALVEAGMSRQATVIV
jgi:mannose-1-phosphate guanylyltransferase